ncbi:MAG: LytTR family transcriptional regulator DNA-binding domain-containing protein [Taibaiella sp.]|nr:LytTR family transcriptional regulator DNA-binding domain-containing protein [Taibaiella sp.]
MKTYLDKWWFRLILVLITSLFVTEIGSSDSLMARFGKDLIKEYLATAIISITVVELVYFINARLQRRYPWGKGHTWLRVLLQMVLGWIVPVIVVLGLATIYFGIYGVDIRRTDYIFFAIPLVIALLLCLNMLFITAPQFILLFQNNQEEDAQPQEELENPEKSEKPLKRIKVPYAKGVMILEPQHVKAAYIVNKRVIIRNSNDQEVLTDLKLDELEEEYLPADDFFRINRQLIVYRRTCIGFESLDYNKMKVQLSITTPVEPIVSQLKSKSFREWIAAED